MDFPGIGFASLLLISLLQCRSTYSFCRWLFNSRRWHYYCGISESVFARERGRIWWDGCRCRCRCSQVSYFYLVYVVAARLLNIRHHKYLRFWVTIFFFFPFQFDFCRRLSTENSRGLVPNLFRTSSGGKEPASQQPHQQSHQASAGPKLGYRSMVSVDDVPELFASFDSKTTFFLKLEIVNSLTSLIPPSVSTSIPH